MSRGVCVCVQGCCGCDATITTLTLLHGTRSTSVLALRFASEGVRNEQKNKSLYSTICVDLSLLGYVVLPSPRDSPVLNHRNYGWKKWVYKQCVRKQNKTWHFFEIVGFTVFYIKKASTSSLNKFDKNDKITSYTKFQQKFCVSKHLEG